MTCAPIVPKEFIKRHCPKPDSVRNHRLLQFFGEHLHSPNLWHLNRRSVARGVALGVFWALVPLPLQMIGVVASAILWRANIPIGLVLVWLTNPFTIPPIFLGTYLFGNWLLGKPGITPPDHITIEWFTESIGEIWLPLVLGSLSIGIALATLSYFAIDYLWRYAVRKRWKSRTGSRIS